MIVNATPQQIEADKKSAIPGMYTFEMTIEEAQLFHKTIRDARHYLEFGAGGSTFEVLLRTKARVWTVESSPEWVANMRSWDFISNAEREGRLTIEQVDIGKTGEWGNPMEMDKRDLFPAYSSQVFSRHLVRFDTILIDGRFRVASALNSLLHCGLFTRFLIHDFWERPQYRVLLKYLDVKSYAGTLLVAGPKHGLDPAEIQATIEEYQYIKD